ncbi:hypothetical protein ACFQX7_24590 [Luedemannella flava]
MPEADETAFVQGGPDGDDFLALYRRGTGSSVPWG